MRNFEEIFNSVLYKIERFQAQRKVNRLINHVRKEVTPMHQGNTEGGANPVLLCLVYNGTYFIESFMDHYLRLGFKEFVFIDNNSTDDTVNKLKEHNVTILRSTLPYRIYKWAFKQFLVHEYGENRWSLYVDIDELWDYPYSSRISVPAFINYLDKNHYNAVQAHLLDMFTDKTISAMNEIDSDELRKEYPYYDVSSLIRQPYQKAYNKVNNPAMEHYWGGIHHKIFEIADIYLTKFPLIKWNPRISVHETSHTSTFIDIADVSSILLHYKFVKGFFSKTANVIEKGNYWNNSKTYTQYLDKIKNNPNLVLKTSTAKRYDCAEQLLEEKVLVESDKFVSFTTQYKDQQTCAE